MRVMLKQSDSKQSALYLNQLSIRAIDAFQIQAPQRTVRVFSTTVCVLQ
jgi:hypothetical protein